MAFSYVTLPGQPALVAALDHAVELGGHQVNHGGKLRLLPRVAAESGAVLLLHHGADKVADACKRCARLST